MSDNFFVQHPEVMRYILEHEKKAQEPLAPLDAWRDDATYTPVIPCEDEPTHTEMTPYCDDPECPCHQDVQQFFNLLTKPYLDGLCTWPEAERLFEGKQV